MICVICNEKIIEDKEKWVRLTDFNKGVKTGEVFNHLECWKERFKITNSTRKKKMYAQFQQSIGAITKGLNPNKKSVYEITP